MNKPDGIPAAKPSPRGIDGGILGVPGQQVFFSAVIPSEGVADQPAGSPGRYNVVFVLSRSAERAGESGEVKPHDEFDGNSYLKIKSDWSDHVAFAAKDANGRDAMVHITVNYRKNADDYLGKIYCDDIEAADFGHAVALAYRAVATRLSHLSIQAVQPFHVQQIDAMEVATQSWQVRCVLPPPEVIYHVEKGGHLVMVPEYAACASLYREALNSNSPMYSFLCFYSILEWAKEYQDQRARLATERGETPPTLPSWDMPTKIEEMRAWACDLFPGGVPWSTFGLEAMFPAESRGKSMGAIYEIFRPIRDGIAHNLGLKPEGVFSPHDDIENLELVHRWLSLAHCLVRRRLKDFFPEAISYPAQTADQSSG